MVENVPPAPCSGGWHSRPLPHAFEAATLCIRSCEGAPPGGRKSRSSPAGSLAAVVRGHICGLGRARVRQRMCLCARVRAIKRIFCGWLAGGSGAGEKERQGRHASVGALLRL